MEKTLVELHRFQKRNNPNNNTFLSANTYDNVSIAGLLGMPRLYGLSVDIMLIL